jgi:hypothetical protein
MKKHLLILTLIFCSALHYSFAQVTFQKAIDADILDEARDVKQTTDNGFIITGYTYYIPYSSFNLFLIKTNLNGDLIWKKSFTEFYVGHCNGISVQQTNDGGYIAGGNQDGRVFLVKLNMSGDTSWYITYGVGGTCNSILQLTDNNYIILGLHGDYTSSSADALLMKINSVGDTLWTKTFGGLKRDDALSGQPTTDGGYVLAGYTKSFGVDSADVYLIKTNEYGDTLWTRTYGGVLDDYGNSVKQTYDGGYIIAGSTASFGAGGSDVYIVKTDSGGNVQWSKTFGGTADDIGYSIQQTTDGGYIVSGSTKSFGANGAYMIRTDNSGNIQWSRAVIGSDFRSVEQTHDGGYILAGSIFITPGNVDILIVKTDSLGNAGCNEIDPATITGNPATQSLGTSTQISPITFPLTIYPPLIVFDIGTDSTLCTTVVVNETQATASVNIFPNPTTNYLTIETSQKATIEIINIQGQIIKTLQTTEDKINVDVSALPGGVYIIKLNTAERSVVRKFVKQ